MHLPIGYRKIPQDMPNDGKQLQSPVFPESSLARPPGRRRYRWLVAAVIAGLCFLSLWVPKRLTLRTESKFGLGYITCDRPKTEQLVRRYNLTIGARWLNLDGGFWRGVLVCNGEAPCPTLYAEEGDIVELNVHNDLFSQVSMHWSGMGHRRFGFWNDGTGGLNQYGLFQRGNFTTRYDTTGQWGLNWYADHTGTGVIDGAHGLAYIAPSPSRPRPYHLITSSSTELSLIHEAERNVQHMLVWNYYRRDASWRVLEYKGEGTNLNCYDSILVNAKGRRHCRHPDYSTFNGRELDESGCAIEAGNKGVPCTPTDADYEVIETHGRPWIMLNVLNIGFEHAVRFSIDNHKMWIVANDGGFVEPQLVDVLYISNGVRYTIMVKLDQEGADYAMRMVSTNTHQVLYGFSILRYPALRYPVRGAPMIIPPPRGGLTPCVYPDGAMHASCNTTSAASLRPYPPSAPPASNKTLHFATGSRPSKYERHVTEFYLNQKPWQLYHAQMAPALFIKNVSAVEAPFVGDLPWGTTVDIIVRNGINETIPLYKHGEPMYLLGSAADAAWEWDTVEDALRAGVALNVKTPAKQLVHELPPLGWAVLRWKIMVRGATMLHSNKFSSYALGMAAALLEGMESNMVDEVPEYVKMLPHVDFTPANDGVFG